MFKKYSGPELRTQDVVNQLVKIQELEFDVYEKGLDSYIIKVDDSKVIMITKRNHKWTITAEVDGIPVYVKNPSTLNLLVSFLQEAARELEIDIEIKNEVKSVRIKSTEPLANKSKILSLIKERKVTSIFDPYFDSKSLTTLHALAKLGMKFNSKVKCLTTKSLDRIDLTLLNDFKSEFSIDMDIQKCGTKEHRRFLILDYKDIIIIGCSLNDINKNETIYEELNKMLKTEDLAYFEDEWRKSTTTNC